MDLDADGLHVLVAYAAVLLGVVGPVVAVVYSLRVERRDVWRRPMVLTGILTFLLVLGAYLSGRWLVSERPALAEAPGVAAHLAFADRLLLPTSGYVVLVLLTGLLHARVGILKTLLPALLSGFAVIVLVLVVLSGDEGARLLLDRVRDSF